MVSMIPWLRERRHLCEKSARKETKQQLEADLPIKEHCSLNHIYAN